MNQVRIKLPPILNPNAYFVVVILLTGAWAFSETLRKADGFAWVVLFLATLVIINGVINILLEDIDYSDIYTLKNEIISVKNGINYISLFLFLITTRFWFAQLKPIGPILFLLIVSPLFLAICCVLILEIKKILTNGFSLSGAFITFSFLFYMIGNGIRLTIADSFGDAQIGSFFEKNDYTAKYFVNLFPNENEAKNYRLPADIHIYYEINDNEDSFSTTKCIRLGKIYFPQGGYLIFNDDGINESLTFGEKVSLMDSESKHWDVELIDEKVK